MKKFLAIFIIFSFVASTPVVVFADITSVPFAETASEPYTGIQSPKGAETIDNGAGTNNTLGQSGSDILQSATAGCGSGNLGGSLGGVAGQLQQAIQGLIPGQAGQVLSSVLGNNLPGIIGQLTGNSVAGQAITSLLSGNASGLLGSTGLGNLLGGSGLGSLLGGSGLGGLSGLAGLGGLGGVLGLAGGLLGGSEVPVNDALVRSQTHQIQTDQDTQVKVVCVQNVLVRQAANQFAVQDVQAKLNAANSGNAGTPYYQWGYPKELSYVADQGANYWVNIIGQLVSNPKFAAGAQQYFAQDYSYRTDLKTQLACPVIGSIDSDACWHDLSKCGDTPEQRSYNRNIVSPSNYPGCTQEGTDRVLADAGYQIIGSRQNQQTTLENQGGGYFGQAKCIDPVGYTGAFQGCQAWETITPPSTVQSVTNAATNLGAQKQAGASEIGQLVNSLFAQLAQTTLTSLTGMLGLSQKSSNGSGSYLDQATNGTTSVSLSQAQSALQGDIEASIVTELAYESVLNDFLNNLADASAVFSDMAACFGKAGAPSIGTTTPQILVAQASTTLSAILTPQTNEKNALLTASQKTLAQLQQLDDQVQSAQTVANVNALSDEYQALVSSNALHTQNDITFLTSDRDASKTTLDTLVSNVSASIKECHTQ